MATVEMQCKFSEKRRGETLEENPCMYVYIIFVKEKNVSKLVFKTSNLFDFYMLDEYRGCYNPFSTENVISLNLKQTF